MKKPVLTKVFIDGVDCDDILTDEVYGEVYTCTTCETRFVDNNFKYCPYCGDEF